MTQVASESKSSRPKTHAELIAEEQERRAEEQVRREEELKRRAEEQVRREEELKRRAEEEVRREEELKRRAEEEVRREEELKRRAEAEKLVQEELQRRAEAEALVKKELELRKQIAALESPGVRSADAMMADDPRIKRQNDDATDGYVGETHKQLTQEEHLNKKEAIESRQMEKGVAHEAAGVDKHRLEAYEHEQITRQREEEIKRQELERVRQEEELKRLEGIRIKKEMERLKNEEYGISSNSDTNGRRLDEYDYPRSDDHAKQEIGVQNSANGVYATYTVLVGLLSFLL